MLDAARGAIHAVRGGEPKANFCGDDEGEGSRPAWYSDGHTDKSDKSHLFI